MTGDHGGVATFGDTELAEELQHSYTPRRDLPGVVASVAPLAPRSPV